MSAGIRIHFNQSMMGIRITIYINIYKLIGEKYGKEIVQEQKRKNVRWRVLGNCGIC